MALARGTHAWQRDYARRLFSTDLLILLVSVFGSELLWFRTRRAELQVSAQDLPEFVLGYTGISVALVVGWMLALGFYATRDNRTTGSGSVEYKRILEASIRLFGLTAIVLFLSRSELGRGYFLTAFPIGVIALLAGRWIWRQWLIARRKETSYLHRALIVGERVKSIHVAVGIRRDGAAGLHLVGAVTENGNVATDLVDGVPVVAGFNNVLTAIDNFQADTVIFTGADNFGPRRLRELGWELQSRKVDLIMAPALTDIAGPRIHARPVSGLPLIQVDFPAFEGSRHAAKRTFDLIFSGVGLLLLSPVFLWLTIAIRLDSPGPAFFLQKRVGLNGNGFLMIKFRSMVTDAEEQLPGLLDESDGNGVLFKLKSDPRVTKMGSFTRRYSLDELPQLVNVFLGHMSLVGPRPPLAAEVEKYDGWAERRLLVKPGITGLWQVSGRSDLSWEDSIRLDLYYVENWSLIGDVIILYRTVRAILRPSGAY
ncbi:exopolysaccharide biosynthesis polyprenyl glycosylphosphotransferase [Cryobacterium sp. MP_M5]|uniref:sugar transferase n=1 Tax=unclassified Cryobacterium TaxID=2649013 RepID=UPI0018C9D961|nr:MULTISPECIES: sugar transferase [unclassified Cryobacterium]MBG6060164.1 exopolysaccharide biosynthesis polyprenyl glycosylphosphotransferase [Cryobacterium sp. MP_M3]MEC5178600.1 exopolysaccharide biosynthesis polyprenyl glycosylphosphotransferase [Cryobacterium sp. MP_M5]